MSADDEVREASRHFYDALNRMANGDGTAMADTWKHDAAVTAMHPIGGRDEGWDAVKTSFGKVAAHASHGQIALKNQLIRVVGDVAYEVGVEDGRFTFAGNVVSVNHRVTNVYQHGPDGWKVIHHHADVSPAMVDVVRRH